MRFKVPGQDINVRLFERVETVDNQYDIFDVGIEQADGSIDSMVVGGSFSYAKSLVKAMDTNCLLYTSPSPRDRQKSRMPSSA